MDNYHSLLLTPLILKSYGFWDVSLLVMDTVAVRTPNALGAKTISNVVELLPFSKLMLGCVLTLKSLDPVIATIGLPVSRSTLCVNPVFLIVERVDNSNPVAHSFHVHKLYDYGYGATRQIHIPTKEDFLSGN
jgi:hypothetical protein